MIKTFVVVLLGCLVFGSCNKKNTETHTIVEYQVTATNSSNIAITYNNILAQRVQLNAQNSWVFDVTDPPKPFQAYLQASSSSPTSAVQSSCTVNILVNGTVVKTATVNSNTVATAEAETTVQ